MAFLLTERMTGWHPCDDGLAPIVEAVWEISSPDIRKLSEWLRNGRNDFGSPFYDFCRILNFQWRHNTPGVITSTSSRKEITRRWLQSNGLAADSNEFVTRLEKLRESIRKWQEQAKHYVAMTKDEWKELESRNRNGFVEVGYLLGEAGVEEFNELLEEAGETWDYLNQLNQTIAAKIAGKKKQQSEVVSYNANWLREYDGEFETVWVNLRHARFNIYRDLFPWFGPAMADAGFDLLAKEDSIAVCDQWKRANELWSRLTNLAPLAMQSSWENAAAAAGWNDLSDIDGMQAAILKWAAAKIANLPPGAVDLPNDDAEKFHSKSGSRRGVDFEFLREYTKGDKPTKEHIDLFREFVPSFDCNSLDDWGRLAIALGIHPEIGDSMRSSDHASAAKYLIWSEQAERQKKIRLKAADAPVVPPNGEPTGMSRKMKQLEWVAKAMMIVQDNPEWSDTKIADKVGKSPSTLCRNATYKAAAAISRGRPSDVRRGHVDYDPDSGLQDVVAYDQAYENFDE